MPIRLMQTHTTCRMLSLAVLRTQSTPSGCMRKADRHGMNLGLRQQAPHRRAPRPHHPPCPYPGDERRQLPAQAEPVTTPASVRITPACPRGATGPTHARDAASRAHGASPRARDPPVDYGDKPPSSPWDNFTPGKGSTVSAHTMTQESGYIESFNARLRDELLNGEIFYTLREAQVLIESWRRHYNAIRPQGSLGYPTRPATRSWRSTTRADGGYAPATMRRRLRSLRSRRAPAIAPRHAVGGATAGWLDRSSEALYSASCKPKRML